MKLAAAINEFYFCDSWNEYGSDIKVAVMCIFCFWKLTMTPYMKTVQQISWGMEELKLLENGDWCHVVRLSLGLNILAPELFSFISAHPVYKMWIIQEPNKLALWNKLHFEEKKTESIEHV